jgi:hypothetical protein
MGLTAEQIERLRVLGEDYARFQKRNTYTPYDAPEMAKGLLALLAERDALQAEVERLRGESSENCARIKELEATLKMSVELTNLRKSEVAALEQDKRSALWIMRHWQPCKLTEAEKAMVENLDFAGLEAILKEEL